MDEYDVIVIGSGFGGAVASSRLAQAGLSVLVLERGRRYEAGDFPALPEGDRLMPDPRRWTWQNEQGLWDLADLGEIVSAQAAGYGGGSLIYANVHLRPPASVFDRTWPEKFQGSALESYFDLAASMLDVAPIDRHPTAFAKTAALEGAVKKLGRDVLRPPLAVTYEDRINAFGEAQSGCDGCGKCCSGCPRRAKNTLDLNYLAVAENNGARVFTQCEVVGLQQEACDPERGDRWVVEYVDHLTARVKSVAAASVFLCAGSVHSTRLLKKARLLPGNEKLQERVGTFYFPNADAAGMVYDTAGEPCPSKGPTITTSTVHWNEEGTSFFMIQDGGYATELERMTGMLRAPLWAGRNRLWPDEPNGARPRPTAPAPTPYPGVALVSPLDAALDASGEGALEKLASKQLRAAWPRLLRELERPLLLPSIVDATIDGALDARFERSWCRRLGSGHFVVRGWRRVVKWMAARFLAPSDQLSGHALNGVLGVGGLDRDQYAREVLGYAADGGPRRMMLLAMGRDEVPGALVYDAERDRLTADLDLFHLTPRYTSEELLMKDVARELSGELRVNPAWEFLGKPITVHSQGGCRMSTNAEDGVTRADGQVHGCPGLYVMDASVFCQSVGVNPSATILAIAECNVLEFIRARKQNARWPAGDASAGAREYQSHVDAARRWRERARDWDLSPREGSASPEFGTEPLGLKFRETMQGYCVPIAPGEDPVNDDAQYRRLEMRARPEHPVLLELHASVVDLRRFFEDFNHRLEITGSIELVLPGEATKRSFDDVTGRLELFVPRYKPYGLSPHAEEVQTRLAPSYTTRVGEQSPDAERFLRYDLSFAKDDWRLHGYKRVRQDPGIDAWRDTSALFTKLGVPVRDAGGRKQPLGAPDSIAVRAAGVVHVDLTGFLYDQLPSFEVTGTSDPARVSWAIGKFASFFFGTLQRVYLPEAQSALETLFQPRPSSVRHEPRRGSARP